MMVLPQFSQATAGATGAILLRQPFGARAFTLGQAYSALGDDVFGMSYNPAILSRLRESQMGTQYIGSLGGSRLGYVGVASPLNPSQSLGLSLAYMSAGPDSIFDANGADLGRRDFGSDLLGELAYARAWPMGRSRLHVGLGGKLYRSVILDELQATTYAADFGGLFETPLRGGVASVGGGLANIGPGVRYTGGISGGATTDPLPTTARLSAAYASPILQYDSLSAALQLERIFYDNVFYESVGLEYDYHRLCAFRLGYRLGPDAGQLTLGAGINVRGLSFDYGIGLMQALGNVQNFSLTYRFSIPGIRYGKSIVDAASPTETLASDILEIIKEGRLFDAAAAIARMQTAFPDRTRPRELQEVLRRELIRLAAEDIDSARYSYALALQSYQRKIWEDAVPAIAVALKKDPENGELKRALKEARENLDSLNRQRKLEEQARAAVLFELANQSYEAGDYNEALRIAAAILAVQSYQPAASLKRRIELKSQPRPKPSAPKRKTRVRAAPVESPPPQNGEWAEQLYNEAIKDYLAGDLEKARAKLAEAVKLDSDNANLRNFLKSVEKALKP